MSCSGGRIPANAFLTGSLMLWRFWEVTAPMFSKLALKNTVRSVRDYAVYFLTMTLGVCLFYMFNSMNDQQAMIQLTSSQKENVQQLTEILGYVSVLVAIILGFLILYANRFLIRRRKK